MPRLVYALLSGDLIVDRESGSVSFIRAVEHVQVRALPARLPALWLGSLWELDGSGAFAVELRLRAPSGAQSVLGRQDVPAAQSRLHRLNFRLGGLDLTEEGRHALILALHGGDKPIKAAELPLYVIKVASGNA
ncbi:hypothetical protein [Desulfovibrio aminophilus]|uniref:hypothetical protein n=1 Tax=Desulfovibrio aminophilus TaxID=81425 RepID=UPI0003FAF56D|nr:hypothetical protein [Desulfovibrio aminophilus]